MQFLEKELYTILWTSRKPENFEDFKEYMNIDDLNVEKVNKLWNKTVECRLKYKELFKVFLMRIISTITPDFGYGWRNSSNGRTIRQFFDRDAVLWACMDDMEAASEAGEDTTWRQFR